MYEAYWGFARSPFSARAVRESLAASPVHAEALARLDFLLGSRSPLGLLLGECGSGKSAVLAVFAERATRAGALACRIAAAAAGEEHVLPALAEALGVAESGERLVLWRRLVDRLAELRFEGVSAAVLLDDLDRAAPTTLALVERLLAVVDAPLTIVASARPDAAPRIGRRLLEQVALRIELTPWNEAESREHLQRSLEGAGRTQPAFEKAAVRRLIELSAGAPRRLNQLAQLALLAGAGQRLSLVDERTIDAVHDELSTVS